MPEHITGRLYINCRKVIIRKKQKKQCYKEAKDRGYQVQIKSKTTGYVRVILWYDVVFPFGLRKKYVIDGYEYAG